MNRRIFGLGSSILFLLASVVVVFNAENWSRTNSGVNLDLLFMSIIGGYVLLALGLVALFLVRSDLKKYRHLYLCGALLTSILSFSMNSLLFVVYFVGK